MEPPPAWQGHRRGISVLPDGEGAGAKVGRKETIQRLFVRPGSAVKICRCRQVIGIDFSLAADPGWPANSMLGGSGGGQVGCCGVLWPRGLPSGEEGALGKRDTSPHHHGSAIKLGVLKVKRKSTYGQTRPQFGRRQPWIWGGHPPSSQRRKTATKRGRVKSPPPPVPRFLSLHSGPPPSINHQGRHRYSSTFGNN